MAIHDAYARRTPYEVAIPGRDFTRDHFPRIRDEAAAGGTDTRDPARFVFLGSVGHAIESIAGEGRPDPVDDPYGEVRRHGSILFHAFHFWTAGENLLLLSTDAARWIVDRAAESPSAALPPTPADAGYLQLPRNLFWGEAAETGAPEPVDGLFWTRGGEGVLNLLAVFGLREDRPGISVVDLPGITPPVLADALAVPARESGEDFESGIPGSELEGLYGVETGAELVKLLGGTFALLHGHPECLAARTEPSMPVHDPAADDTEAPTRDPTAPPPSALPYRRIEAPPSGSGE